MRYYLLVADKRPEVVVSIGQMYEEGSDDLRRDYEKAYQYYCDGCDRGIQEAYNKLGGMYKQVELYGSIGKIREARLGQGQRVLHEG